MMAAMIPALMIGMVDPWTVSDHIHPATGRPQARARTPDKNSYLRRLQKGGQHGKA